MAPNRKSPRVKDAAARRRSSPTDMLAPKVSTWHRMIAMQDARRREAKANGEETPILPYHHGINPKTPDEFSKNLTPRELYALRLYRHGLTNATDVQEHARLMTPLPDLIKPRKGVPSPDSPPRSGRSPKVTPNEIANATAQAQAFAKANRHHRKLHLKSPRTWAKAAAGFEQRWKKGKGKLVSRGRASGGLYAEYEDDSDVLYDEDGDLEDDDHPEIVAEASTSANRKDTVAPGHIRDGGGTPRSVHWDEANEPRRYDPPETPNSIVSPKTVRAKKDAGPSCDHNPGEEIPHEPLALASPKKHKKWEDAMDEDQYARAVVAGKILSDHDPSKKGSSRRARLEVSAFGHLHPGPALRPELAVFGETLEAARAAAAAEQQRRADEVSAPARRPSQALVEADEQRRRDARAGNAATTGNDDFVAARLPLPRRAPNGRARLEVSAAHRHQIEYEATEPEFETPLGEMLALTRAQAAATIAAQEQALADQVEAQQQAEDAMAALPIAAVGPPPGARTTTGNATAAAPTGARAPRAAAFATTAAAPRERTEQTTQGQVAGVIANLQRMTTERQAAQRDQRRSPTIGQEEFNRRRGPFRGGDRGGRGGGRARLDPRQDEVVDAEDVEMGDAYSEDDYMEDGQGTSDDPIDFNDNSDEDSDEPSDLDLIEDELDCEITVHIDDDYRLRDFRLPSDWTPQLLDAAQYGVDKWVFYSDTTGYQETLPSPPWVVDRINVNRTYDIWSTDSLPYPVPFPLPAWHPRSGGQPFLPAGWQAVQSGGDEWYYVTPNGSSSWSAPPGIPDFRDLEADHFYGSDGLLHPLNGVDGYRDPEFDPPAPEDDRVHALSGLLGDLAPGRARFDGPTRGAGRARRTGTQNDPIEFGSSPVLGDQHGPISIGSSDNSSDGGEDLPRSVPRSSQDARPGTPFWDAVSELEQPLPEEDDRPELDPAQGDLPGDFSSEDGDLPRTPSGPRAPTSGSRPLQTPRSPPAPSSSPPPLPLQTPRSPPLESRTPTPSSKAPRPRSEPNTPRPASHSPRFPGSRPRSEPNTPRPSSRPPRRPSAGPRPSSEQNTPRPSSQSPSVVNGSPVYGPIDDEQRVNNARPELGDGIEDDLLYAENQRLQARIDQLEQDLVDAQQEIQDRTQEANEARSDLVFVLQRAQDAEEFNESLSEEIVDLRQEAALVAQPTADTDDGGARIQQILDDRDDMVRTVQSLVDELDVERAAVAAAQEECDSLRQQLVAGQEAAAQATADANAARADAVEAASFGPDDVRPDSQPNSPAGTPSDQHPYVTRAAYQRQQQRLLDSRKEAKDLQRQLDDCHEHGEALQEIINDLEKQLEESHSGRNAAIDRAEFAENKLHDCIERCENQSQQIDDLERRLDDCEKARQSASSDDEPATDISSLRKLSERCRRRREMDNLDVKHLQTVVDDLEKKLLDSRKSPGSASLATQLGIVERALNDQRSTYHQHEWEVLQLKKDVQKATLRMIFEVLWLKKSLQKALITAQTSDEALEAARGTIADLEATLEEALAAATSSDECDKRCEAAEEQNGYLQDRIDELEKELEECHEHGEDLQSQLDAMKTKKPAPKKLVPVIPRSEGKKAVAARQRQDAKQQPARKRLRRDSKGRWIRANLPEDVVEEEASEEEEEDAEDDESASENGAGMVRTGRARVEPRRHSNEPKPQQDRGLSSPVRSRSHLRKGKFSNPDEVSPDDLPAVLQTLENVRKTQWDLCQLVTGFRDRKLTIVEMQEKQIDEHRRLRVDHDDLLEDAAELKTDNKALRKALKRAVRDAASFATVERAGRKRRYDASY